MGFTLLAARTIRCRLSPSAFFHSLGLRYPLTSTRMPFLIASNDERLVFLAHFSTVISEDWRVTSPVALLVTRLLTARAKRITLASVQAVIFGSVATKPLTTVELMMFFLPLLALVLLASIFVDAKKLMLCFL